MCSYLSWLLPALRLDAAAELENPHALLANHQREHRLQAVRYLQVVRECKDLRSELGSCFRRNRESMLLGHFRELREGELKPSVLIDTECGISCATIVII